MAATSSDRREGGERFLAGRSGRLFAVLILGSMLTVLGKQLVPVLLPTIIATIDITAFQAGVALTAMELGYALLQYPSGRFSDRLTRKTVLMAAIATVLVGYAVLSGAVTYAVFLVGVVFLGAGHGLYAPVSRALLSELFVEKRGQAFGVYMMSTDVGGAIAATLAVVVLAVATWHDAYLPLLLFMGAVALLLQRWSDERVMVSYVPLDVVETGARLFSSRPLRLLVVGYALYIFAIRGFVGFLPTFLHTTHGFSLTMASTAFGSLFVVGLVAKPLAGRVSDVLPRTLVGAGALGFAVLGIAVVISFSATVPVFAGIAVYAVGHKGFGPVMQAYLMDVFPDESMGGDLGAIRTVYVGFGSLGPMYVGYVSGRAGFTLAFAGFIVGLLAAGVLVLAVGRSDRG